MVGADLSGPGGVAKDTGGTVMLSGMNFYAGPTRVDNGTLLVANASALPDGSSLTVGASASMAFGASPAASETAGQASTLTQSASEESTLTQSASEGNLQARSASEDNQTAVSHIATFAPTLPPSVPWTLPAMSNATVDAVFASPTTGTWCPSAFAGTVAPADSARPAIAWAWIASSYAQNQKTDLPIAALDTVLARYGV